MTNVDDDHRLPNLEVTLGHLSRELLRAVTNYPELITAHFERGEKIPPNVIRITHHYTDAMLAYGFTAEYEGLQQVAKWFSVPLPENATELDSVEMNRLEALLLLRPDDPSVAARLRLLLGQWVVNGQFNVEAREQRFDALWASKILWMAHQKNVVNGASISSTELRRWTNYLLAENFQDKDMAFALRLRYELAGGLTKAQQQKHLAALINRAKANGGMWGVGRSGWIVDLIHKQELLNAEFTSNKDRDALREIAVSTCYVIENLMPMADQYPEIRRSLNLAMELWWGVFQGDDAIRKLITLFSRRYDFLFILFRTLCAVREYIKQPLIQVSALYLAEQFSGTPPAESSEAVSIVKALQQWIPVTMGRASEKLKLGLSDSSVMRVYPQFHHPLASRNEPQVLDIPQVKSVIVKYGKREEINKERDSYKHLPDAIRDSFVPIPQDCYEETGGRTFVIMSDLHNYWTVYETLPRREEFAPAIARELGGFLLEVHRGDPAIPPMFPLDSIMQLYLEPMLAQVRQIFRFIDDNNLVRDPSLQADELRHTLLKLIGGLMPLQMHLEGFPAAYMHGDLHTRNIMVRRLRRSDRERLNRALDFKLIDLEKLDSKGDAAHDAGQLLMDLELLRQTRVQAEDQAQISAIIDALHAAYVAFAAERNDRTFLTRMQLAQGRALIRIAKAQIKYGQLALAQKQYLTVSTLARDMLNYAEQSVPYLQAVLKTLV